MNMHPYIGVVLLILKYILYTKYRFYLLNTSVQIFINICYDVAVTVGFPVT